MERHQAIGFARAIMVKLFLLTAMILAVTRPATSTPPENKALKPCPIPCSVFRNTIINPWNKHKEIIMVRYVIAICAS